MMEHTIKNVAKPARDAIAIRQAPTKFVFLLGDCVNTGQSLFLWVRGGDLEVVVAAAVVTLGCGLGWRPMAEELDAPLVGMCSVVVILSESPDAPETVVCPGTEALDEAVDALV